MGDARDRIEQRIDDLVGDCSLVLRTSFTRTAR